MSGTATLSPAGARLTDGLAAWRRLVVRRRCAAVLRRWLPLAVAGVAAGVVAGRFDGSLPLTVTGAGLACLAAGVAWLWRARLVSVAEAARSLDGELGLDEQVATALWWVTAEGDGNGNPLAARLVERAAQLATEAGGRPDATRAAKTADEERRNEEWRNATRRDAVPAHASWVAAAVLAVAAAAVVASGPPGAHPARGKLADGIADGQRVGRAGLRVPEASAHGASDSRAGGGTARAGKDDKGSRAGAAATPGASAPPGSAASRQASHAAGPTGTPAGRGTPSGRRAASTTAGTRGGATAANRAAGGAVAGTGRSAAGNGQTGARRASAGPGGGRPSPAAGPGQQAGDGRRGTSGTSGTSGGGARAAGASTTGHGGTRGGVPGGATAGTARGSEGGGTRAVRLPDVAGGQVVMIVLPGGEGAVAVRVTPQEFGAQGDGNGGSAAGAAAGPGAAGGAAYVPPDGNEVPFPDQGLLGRYF